MSWLELNETITRYELREGIGRPLVLVHEMGGTLHSWDGMVTHLHPTRPVLRYDMRGAGLSEKLRDVPYIEELADDIVALLDQLQIREPVDLAGCAIGAAVALMCASRHPERIFSVVAVSPVTEVANARRLSLLDIADRMERQGLRSMVDAHLAASYPVATRDHSRVFEEFRARWIANDPESFARYYRMLAELDIRPALGRLKCPVLVIGALQDTLRSAAASEQVAAQIPGARFASVDAGHFMHVQTPIQVAQQIEKFQENLISNDCIRTE